MPFVLPKSKATAGLTFGIFHAEKIAGRAGLVNMEGLPRCSVAWKNALAVVLVLAGVAE